MNDLLQQIASGPEYPARGVIPAESGFVAFGNDGSHDDTTQAFLSHFTDYLRRKGYSATSPVVHSDNRCWAFQIKAPTESWNELNGHLWACWLTAQQQRHARDAARLGEYLSIDGNSFEPDWFGPSDEINADIQITWAMMFINAAFGYDALGCFAFYIDEERPRYVVHADTGVSDKTLIDFYCDEASGIPTRFLRLANLLAERKFSKRMVVRLDDSMVHYSANLVNDRWSFEPVRPKGQLSVLSDYGDPVRVRFWVPYSLGTEHSFENETGTQQMADAMIDRVLLVRKTEDSVVEIVNNLNGVVTGVVRTWKQDEILTSGSRPPRFERTSIEATFPNHAFAEYSRHEVNQTLSYLGVFASIDCRS